MLQGDAGLCLRPRLIEQVRQVWRKGGGQLRLTLGFLGIEGQLQDPAIVPVDATLQLFQQTSGVAETADDQLR
ncbi:hypothetical protein D3C86_1233580 [compost metagenome]